MSSVTQTSTQPSSINIQVLKEEIKKSLLDEFNAILRQELENFCTELKSNLSLSQPTQNNPDQQTFSDNTSSNLWQVLNEIFQKELDAVHAEMQDYKSQNELAILHTKIQDYQNQTSSIYKQFSESFA